MYSGGTAVEPAKDGEDRCRNHGAANGREVHDIVGEVACITRVVDSTVVMRDHSMMSSTMGAL